MLTEPRIEQGKYPLWWPGISSPLRFIALRDTDALLYYLCRESSWNRSQKKNSLYPLIIEARTYQMFAETLTEPVTMLALNKPVVGLQKQRDIDALLFQSAFSARSGFIRKSCELSLPDR